MSKDKDFDNWWNDDILDKSSIHPEDTPLYWAWQGWVAGRKAEREACAKEVEEIFHREASMDTMHEYVKRMAPYEKAAKAIRARGQK